MVKYIYCLIIAIFILACNNQPSTSEKLRSKDSVHYVGENEVTHKGDTTGFFSECEEIINHSALGSLQGVEANGDSLLNLFFADCFDYCKESFQIVFVYKDFDKRKDENYQSLSSEFHQGCSSYFKNFNCFAFVCPRRDPDKQEDIHALNIDFPVAMRTYERITQDKWKLIRKDTAMTYEQYALIRFKAIYHLR